MSCQLPPTLMRHWQIEVALCEDGCQKNNEAVNKAFHSFSPWLWLGSLLWQKRNLLIFHVWHFACSVSRLDHRRGSRGGGGGGGGGWVGFTQRSGCFCKVSKRLWKLCNSDITCNTCGLIYGRHLGRFCKVWFKFWGFEDVDLLGRKCFFFPIGWHLHIITRAQA